VSCLLRHRERSEATQGGATPEVVALLDCFAPLARTEARQQIPRGVGEWYRCRIAAAEKSLPGEGGKSKVPFIDKRRRSIENHPAEADVL
jgi:hypothetical protein